MKKVTLPKKKSMHINEKYDKQMTLLVLTPSCPRLLPTSEMHARVLAQMENGIIQNLSHMNPPTKIPITDRIYNHS